MGKTHVKTLYAIGARLYDPLMKLWVMAVGAEAEGELTNFLRENLNETRTVLELGCGTARNLQTIYSLNLKFKKYLGLDFSPQMLRIARNKFRNKPSVEFREKDVTALDDMTERFDVIFCTWVSSHLKSPSSFVNQAQGLMSKHGRFFLIFFTQPKWYINFWMYPIARYLFSAKPLTEEEVRKFKNIKARHSYAANITTVVEIWEGVGKAV